MRIISGKSIRLRSAELADRKTIYSWLAKSDITSTLMGSPDHPQIATPSWEMFLDMCQEIYFSNLLTERGHCFIIEHKGKAIGHIQYKHIDSKENAVELDIWMANSTETGKGYGSEAVDLLANFLYLEFDVQHVFLAPSEGNRRAIRAFEKAGFHISSKIPKILTPAYPDTVVLMRSFI